ncbi:MAG: hypothetical protein NUV76_12230 [Candidatus Kuenenia sp.]|nr:hypothetical protein [Candidatus Kuenenia sp.]
MALLEQMSIGELTLTKAIRDSSGNYLLAYGTSTPTGAGYAIGCIFVNTSTGKTYQNEGTAAAASFNSIGDIGVADIGANVVTPVKMGTRTVVALADVAATPTIAQLMTSSLFTITPTAARTFTVPTAALTVAGISGATVGTWFDFTVVNTAVFPVTVTGNTGWTLSGNVGINKGSGTFRAVLTNVGSGTEAVTVYRTASGSTITDMALASGKMFVGQATGLAAEFTPSGDATIDVSGVVAIGTGVIIDADINAAAAIVDTKLATIATASKVSNSATTAVSTNTANAIVTRDASGNFSAGTITAGLSGNAATVTTNANLTGDVTSVGNAATIASGAVTRAKQSTAAASKTDVAIPATIATTGNTDAYLVVPETGALSSVDFSGVDALAAHDINYITFSITNLGQAGAGAVVMLAATDANTTKATGGTALSANTKRTLTLTATGGDLNVTQGDRLHIRAAASGMLANTVTFPVYCCRFSGTT